MTKTPAPAATTCLRTTVAKPAFPDPWAGTCILPNMIHGHPPLDEVVVKHLELIQAVITRLANNSFLMKGWALTVTGAF